MSRSKTPRPTLADVATQSGVSLATASVVLNNSKRVHISEQTQQRVKDAADKLGYKPRVRQHSVRIQKTKRIAYVVNRVDKDIAVGAINGANEMLWQHDFMLHVLPYDGNPSLKEAILNDVAAGDYAGVIFASNVTREIEKPNLPANVPVVLLNCYCQGKIDWPAIVPADLVGAHITTQHLIDKGYKRIAHLTGEEWMDAAKLRRDGFRRAMASNDLPVDESMIIEAGWHTRESYIQTMKLLNSDNPPDAIFAGSDEMAIGVYMAVKESGLKIPEDIAVAGYDNSAVSEEMIPALTSYELPYLQMGQLAVETLLSMMHGQEPVIKLIKHEGKLVARESS